jgi:putative phosphoribosyl transferase
MKNLHEDQQLRNRRHVFKDRSDAGRKLSLLLSGLKPRDAVILAIPSGGVPVALEMNRKWGTPFDLLIVRKAQIPWNTEAGFGAVNLDGDVVLNEELVHSIGLSEEVILAQIEKTKEILKKRDALFRKGKAFPDLKDKMAVLVDDGLASGYSMIAGIRFVRKRNPSKITVATPTASHNTLVRISPLVDTLYCLNVREGYPFAVAEAYRSWYDLDDEEVLGLLDQVGQ